jgi:Cysteine-rich secretory protein family
MEIRQRTGDAGRGAGGRRRAARIVALVTAGLCLWPIVALASPHAAAEPPWLAVINRYRAAAGLSPVVDQPAWDAGIKHHLVYVARTPRRYFSGQYVSLHTENPASPYYTHSGALEAQSSDLVSGGVSSAVAAINEWLAAPFHAIGMLRPQLREVAFALDRATGSAGLDVIRGLDYTQPLPATPVLFPGQGITTNLTTFLSGEAPDPLETCGWQNSGAAGLPLIALLPAAPSDGLRARLAHAGSVESTARHDLCVVDANTYHSSDTVYGPTGLAILRGGNAVIVIPRRPLRNGLYRATITQPGAAAIRWSFRVRARG